MLEVDAYLEQRNRPLGQAVMYQQWYDLLFVHYPVDVATVQALLPAGLTVDTYPDSTGTDRGWIGVVPFGMRGIRPRNAPSLAWISAFLETNVRTYVHRDGKDPGVWFFSLDAARWLACAVARATFHLPYFHAAMRIEANGDKRTYQTRRFGSGCQLTAEYEIGPAIEVPPGSFEFWLVERYRLYASAHGGLASGLVHHAPYGVRQASLLRWETDLPQAVGLSNHPPEHVCYSPGVKVEVFRLNML